ncbi:MAG: response regulator transcription factor [Nitrosopumilus sp.]|nr:response regulator transcription factor [Nitrosopumilus sp.]
MKVKCLVVDDEPLAIRLIENHISKIDALEVVGTCTNALQAFEFIHKHQVDLLFLDIKMPNISGVDFIQTLKNPPKTIFTTAYRDYAIESYSLEVVDYLLKPITFERFFKSVERYLRDRQSWENEGYSRKFGEKTIDEFIVIKSGIKHCKIYLNDILFVESIKDYIKIHTSDGECIVSKYKIGDFEQDLGDKPFLRVHRSFIINQEKITAFTINDIEMGSVQIPVGSSYKEKVVTYLNSIKGME